MEYETSTYAVIKEKEDEDKEAKEDRGDDMVADTSRSTRARTRAAGPGSRHAAD